MTGKEKKIIMTKKIITLNKKYCYVHCPFYSFGIDTKRTCKIDGNKPITLRRSNDKYLRCRKCIRAEIEFKKHYGNLSILNFIANSNDKKNWVNIGFEKQKKLLEKIREKNLE